MHVLIIGAGLAGLTCARELERYGVDITILEASDGVGGRVRSDVDDGYIFDRGFQVLFDAYPAAQRQLDLRALDLQPFDPGAIICVNRRRAVLTDSLRDRDLMASLDAALTTVVSPIDKVRTLQLALSLRSQTIDEILSGDDESSLAYLRRQGFSERIIDVFFRPFYGGIFLDRSLQTSAKCFKYDFKMLSEGQTVLPAAGMGRISEQLAQPLSARSAVRLNAYVSDLIEDDERVHGARLVNGDIVRADAVVIATNAQEATRLSGLPTPDGLLQTVTLYFAGDQPIYRGKKILLNAARDAFVNNAQLLTNIAPTYAPPGKHLLSATVLGMPVMSDEDLFKRTLRDLHRMFAGDVQAQAALAQYQPLRLYRIAYAQFSQPPGVHPTLPDNRTEKRNLYFAAEFTEASSLNAAMISGEKCAACVIEDLTVGKREEGTGNRE
jgi:phytoene dehydrogenase-like protein